MWQNQRMARSKPGAIHQRIIEVMKRFPDGISGGQIRQELELQGLRPEDQTHLDRRKRDLKKWFLVDMIEGTQIVNGKPRKVAVYKYIGERSEVSDEGEINIRVKAEVLHAAHGRCQMCGKTISEDQIKLVVDHKKPRAWGGGNSRENLWAICVACNSGKKAYFNSVNLSDELMKRITAYDSIHVRIGETLKAIGVGNRTSPEILDIVADQEDWHKRLRELRYPLIGWEIDTIAYKTKSGRKKVDYILRQHKPWPENPTGLIRQHEKERELQNKKEKN